MSPEWVEFATDVSIIFSALIAGLTFIIGLHSVFEKFLQTYEAFRRRQNAHPTLILPSAEEIAKFSVKISQKLESGEQINSAENTVDRLIRIKKIQTLLQARTRILTLMLAFAFTFLVLIMRLISLGFPVS